MVVEEEEGREDQSSWPVLVSDISTTDARQSAVQADGRQADSQDVIGLCMAGDARETHEKPAGMAGLRRRWSTVGCG